MHNIARNCKSFHFRKATKHDAVVVECGESKDGSPFIVMEKVNHPILILHRDFEYPEPSRRDKNGRMILPPFPELDHELFYKLTSTLKQWRQRGFSAMNSVPPVVNAHKQRMLRDKTAAILRRAGVLQAPNH